MMKMNEKSSHSEHLFVVRIWSETATLPRAACRGSVEHISSGQKFYFTSLDDLSDFIALRATTRPQLNKKGT